MLPRQSPLFVRHEHWIAIAALAAIFLGAESAFWWIHFKQWPQVQNWLQLVIPALSIVAAACVVSSKRPIDASFSAFFCGVICTIHFAAGTNTELAPIILAAFSIALGAVCFMQIPTLEIEPAIRLCKEPMISTIACAGLIVVATTIVHFESAEHWQSKAKVGVSKETAEQQHQPDAETGQHLLLHTGVPLIGLGLFGLMTRSVTIFRLLSIQIVTLGLLCLIASSGTDNHWRNSFPLMLFTIGASAIYSLVLSRTENVQNVLQFNHHMVQTINAGNGEPATNVEHETGMST